MKLLLPLVLLGLVATLQAQDPLDFPSEELQLAGTWYVKAMVSDKDMPEKKKPKKVFPVTVKVLKGGDLQTNITYLKKGQCVEKRILMKKTEEPGKYTAFEGKKTVYAEKVPVEDHYIFHCEGQYHGKKVRGAKLLGRSPEENPQALEEFRKFILRKGFPQENIHKATQSEKCVPEHD